MTSVLRQDYETCDTQVFIEYTIINDKMLKMLNGRYYYDAHGDLHLLNDDTDKDLIGKTL